MSNVIPLLPRLSRTSRSATGIRDLRRDGVFVVFTTIDDTLAAARAGDQLARSMGVPLRIVHFRAVPYALPLDEFNSVSPAETTDFTASLRAGGVNADVRVCVCRSERDAALTLLQPHALVLVGGRRSWWPTRAARWRRTLESAGHRVVFVDAHPDQAAGAPSVADIKERAHA